MTRWFLLLILAAIAPPAGAAPSALTPAALLERAEAAMDRAERDFDADPASARAALDEAIATYRSIVDGGIESPALHRNLGNAHLLRGDTGRAVASFLRAERLDPADPRVRESLAAARAIVRTAITPGPASKVEDVLLFWRGLVPRRTLLTVGLACWALAWGAGSLRLLSRRGGGITVIAAAVAVVCLGSLALEHTLHAINPAGVIVQDGVTGYRGPSEAVYTPTFEQPLRAGVEAAIIEERDGWLRVRLRSGVETWIPANSIERL